MLELFCFSCSFMILDMWWFETLHEFQNFIRFDDVNERPRRKRFRGKNFLIALISYFTER